MKITILNGNPDSEKKDFEKHVNSLSNLISEKNQVEVLNLRDFNIKYCTGCWSCWVKTCGECVTKDASHLIDEKVINSDFIIAVSPLLMGFISTELKKTMDKLIPLLRPYIDIVNGECHHQKRYSKYPKWGVIIEKEVDTDEEDLQICKEIFERFTLNFRSELAFFTTTETKPEEIANEISNI